MSILDLLTEEQAARRLAISPRTLRKLRQDGLLHYVRIRTAIRYCPDDLDRYVESARECRSTDAPAPPYWWFDITVEGRRLRRSTKKKNAREARLIAADALQRESDRPSRDAPWRLREVLGTFWTEHAQRLGSASDIFLKFELISEFLGADKPILDIANSDVMDYRAARRGGQISLPASSIETRPKSWRARFIDRDGRVKPVTAQTVNRDIACLQAAMNWAREMHGKQVPALAWKRLKVAENPHRIRFASADEFARLMDAAHPDLRPIILCAVTTGLRRANILSLEWHQVDLSGSTITIQHTKSGKPGAVRIAPPLRAALARTKPKERRGKVFDTTNFRRRWASAVKSAGMPDFHFHDLRHTFASWARQNGADLADICDALFHSSVSVTMRYAHIRPGHDKTAFDRVGDLLTAQNTAQKRASD